MMKLERHNKMLLLSITLAATSWLSLGFINLPNLAGALGISASAAGTVVNLVSTYSTVTAVISIIGAITGVGAVSSGVAATVLYLIKQKGKATAALW